MDNRLSLCVYIYDDKVGNIGWHMNAWRLIQVVIILYINLHGNIYQEICVHIYITGIEIPKFTLLQ